MNLVARSVPTIQLLRDDAALRVLDEDWDGLYRSSGCSHPSLTRATVAEFFRSRVPQGESCVLLVAKQDGHLVAGLPLVQSSLGVFPRTIAMQSIGDLEVYPADFLVGRMAPPGIRGDLLRRLFSEAPGLFSVKLERVADSSATLLEGEIGGASFIHRELAGHASFLPVPVQESLLWSRFSANFRKNLRKQQDRLAALGGVEWSFLRGAACGPTEIEALLELEVSGWKGAEGSAIRSRPPDLEFYRSVLPQLADAQHLELHFLHVDGVLLAAHLAVRTGRVLSLLKIAYNEEFRRVGPGNMLLLEMMRREIASQEADEVDCLTDMAWHRNWGMPQRAFWTLQVFPRRMLPVAFGWVPRKVIGGLRRSAAASLLRGTVRAVSTRSTHVDPHSA